MNKLMRGCFAAMALWVGVPTGLGLEPSHAVKFPTGDAAWSVTVESVRKPDPQTPPPAEASRQVKSIDIVRLGNLRRDTIQWSDGGSTEYWWLKQPPITLMQGKPGEEIRAMKLGQLGPRRFDESTFSWVGAQTFLGMDSFKGKKVRRYQLETPVEDGEKTTVFALVDSETAEPLAWSDGVKNVIFTFGASLPKEPLVLPSNFKEALARYEAYYAPAQKRGKR